MSWGIVEYWVEWEWGCGLCGSALVESVVLSVWHGLSAAEYLITRLACVNVTFTCERNILSRLTLALIWHLLIKIGCVFLQL